MSDKVKAAVIGLGVGMAHAKGYLACSDAELYAVCDVDPKRLQDRGDELKIPRERQFSDINALLALPELDVVSIGLPNFLHAPIAIEAFKAGKHVLCEKPMATSAAEAQQMIDTAKECNRKVMVCFNYRFRDDSRWLKGLQEEGNLGDVYYARTGWLRCVGIPGFGGWFTQKAMSGGGPLIDLGVHVLDLTLWLMGYPRPVSVSGAAYAAFGPRGMKAWGVKRGATTYDVEDLAAGFVRFENGASLQLEASWASHTKPNRDQFFVNIYGTEGGCELDVANYTDRNTVSFFSEAGGTPVQIRPDIITRGGHERAVAHFIDCIKNDQEPEATGEQGMILMSIIDALYESAKTGREVVIG
jgi:predicted dehydrogenase